MLARYWYAAVHRLDRPGRRSLLSVPASVWVTFKYRRPCLVYWREGTWIHHYRGAKIPHASVGRAAPPHVFTAEARDLFLYGYTPSPGDVVFDVGAGIGAETLLFSRLVGASGHVISLEAHPRTFRRLADLCNANTLANVTPLQVAASDAEGAVVISDRPAHAHNRLVVDGEGIEVRARPVEAIAAELGITRIDLLKMNIEGAEREAIRGVGALLANTHHVCISCHDFLGMPTKAEVRQFLTEHGFAVTAREDAREPWTRDYLYGVRQKPGVSVLKDGSFVGGVCKP